MNIHFNSYKVKYTTLNTILRPVLTSQNIKSMNIFINLDDFFHMLHKPIINDEFQVCGVNAGKQFIAETLNLIAHYTNWASKCKFSAKIFCFYTSSMVDFKNSIYIPNYREKFIQYHHPTNTQYYFVNSAITSSIDLIKTLCESIPNVYIIDSTYLEPSIVPMYIYLEKSTTDWNILISRDPYDLQYAYMDKWTYISPKGDNSHAITRKNFWEYINVKEKIYNEKDKVIRYNPSLYPFAKTIVGDTYRSIPRLRRIGWRTLFKYLDKVTLSEESIHNDVLVENEFIKFLKGSKNLTDEEFNNNSRCIRVDYQVWYLLSLDKAIISSQIKDLEDLPTLTSFLSKNFYEFPVNLNLLLKDIRK